MKCPRLVAITVVVARLVAVCVHPTAAVDACRIEVAS